MNRLRHPALLLVDAVSSLGSIEYRMDEWEVDVTVCGSQVCDELQAGRHSCETQTPVPVEWSQVAPGPQSWSTLQRPVKEFSALQPTPAHTETRAIPRKRFIELP